MPPPPGIRPGDWVQPAPGLAATLYDDPNISSRPVGHLPIGVAVLVLSVIYVAAGHEQVLVLHGDGRLNWCWGGALVTLEEDA